MKVKPDRPLIIYKATCISNGKSYIGQTCQALSMRKSIHFSCAMRSPKSAFHLAIKKYGQDSFVFEIVDNANSNEELDEKERYWILFLNTLVPNGYNLAEGGDAPPMRGRTHSEETRRKMSIARNGRVLSEESRKKLSASKKGVKKPYMCGPNHPFYGKPMKEETRRKLSESHSLVNLSAERRKRISEGQRNKPPDSEETRRKKGMHNRGRKLSKEHKAKILAAEGWRKRHDARKVTWDGKQVSLRELCRDKKIPFSTVWNRLKRNGWNIVDSINTPVRSNFKNKGETKN